MNVAFREAQMLAAAMAGILRRRDSDPALEAYDRRFRQEWKVLLGATAQVSAVPGRVSPLRNVSAVLSSLPASGTELDAILAALGLQLMPSVPTAAHAPTV